MAGWHSLRDDAPTPTTLRVLRAALWWIPGLALLTFGTGAAVLAEGARGGPWAGAGVLSTLAIATASLWLLRRLRRDITRRTPMVGAVQWGIPAMTLAAAYLMADRPQNPLLAIAPVAIAVAVAAVAWRYGGPRQPDPAARWRSRKAWTLTLLPQVPMPHQCLVWAREVST